MHALQEHGTKVKAMPKPGHPAEFSTSSACSETRLLLGLHIQKEGMGIPQPKDEIPVLE